MRAGRLRYNVIIQQVSHAQDAYGETTETWTEFVSAWAAIEPLKGNEYFDASNVQSQVDVRIVMRYRAGITTSMRVVYGSRVFDIQSVIEPNSARRELHLMCREYFGDSTS